MQQFEQTYRTLKALNTKASQTDTKQAAIEWAAIATALLVGLAAAVLVG